MCVHESGIPADDISLRHDPKAPKLLNLLPLVLHNVGDFKFYYPCGNIWSPKHWQNLVCTHAPLSLASSTSTISSSRGLGDLTMTLWTVRSSVVHASLWNTITTLVRGRSSGYTFVLHLQNIKLGNENGQNLQTIKFKI